MANWITFWLFIRNALLILERETFVRLAGVTASCRGPRSDRGKNQEVLSHFMKWLAAQRQGCMSQVFFCDLCKTLVLRWNKEEKIVSRQEKPKPYVKWHIFVKKYWLRRKSICLIPLSHEWWHRAIDKGKKWHLHSLAWLFFPFVVFYLLKQREFLANTLHKNLE